MLKRCTSALKTICALALVLAFFPLPAFAEAPVRTEDADGEAAALTDDGTRASSPDASVETEPDPSKLQKTDVSELADVDTDAARAVEDYFDARSGEVADGTPASDDDALDLSKKVSVTSEQRTEGFQQMAEDANLQITDADTTVTVSDVEQSGSKLTLTAYEQTVLYYDDLADGEGGSDVAIIGTEHEITLSTAGEGTVIKADAYDESDLTGIDTTNEASAAQSAGASAEPAAAEQDTPAAESAARAASGAAEEAAQPESALVSPLEALASWFFPEQAEAATYTYDADYDVEKAIAYADKYWTKYNSSYRNFNPVGGDCANFVSQCMKAGGLDQKKSGSNLWYYTSGTNYSESWTYCPTMVSTLKARGKYYYIKKKNLGTAASAEKIYPGSPVIYRNSSGVYYHAVICTGYNSAGTPVISAHNNDRYHVPFTYAGTACATIQLTAAAPGSTFSNADGRWLTDEGASTATLTLLSSSLTAYTLPAAVENDGKKYTVTGFSAAAFKGNKKLTKVTVSGPAAIPEEAFMGCTSLKTVKLGASVTAIGARAFQSCTALKKIAFPQGLASLGQQAFKGCTALKSADLGTTVATLPKGLFQGCKKLKTLSGGTKVTKIASYVFDGCKKLADVKALKKATSVGKRAFRNCDSLAKVTSFSKVKTVGAEAFRGCDKLAKVSGFGALTQVGKGAFRSCTVLKKATLTSTVLNKIGDWAFYKDRKLRTIKIKSSLLNAGNVGFSAFTLTATSPKVYVPKAKKKAYKTAFVKHGLSPQAKFKKY